MSATPRLPYPLRPDIAESFEQRGIHFKRVIEVLTKRPKLIPRPLHEIRLIIAVIANRSLAQDIRSPFERS